MRIVRAWVALAFAGALATGAGQVAPQPQADPCEELYDLLSTVPHVSLVRTVRPAESIWVGEAPADCQVAFETNDASLGGSAAPDLIAEPGTPLHARGWTMIPEILADGAGSGIHGIQKDAIRCVIRWEQPAYIDDDGAFVQSDTLELLIQCRGLASP